VRIDLSELQFIDSFGLTLLAASFHVLKHSGAHGFVRRPRQADIHQELLDMGLYESLGIDLFGPRTLRRDRVDIRHITAFEPLFIDHLLDFLESMQPFEEGLRPSIRMALLELIQNFSEHSKSKIGAWIAGQFDTARKRINLCVMDFSMGIPETLRRIPRFYRHGDERLIELATGEGITSVVNSSRGLGLTAIRRFVSANHGTLTILAGRGQVTFSSSSSPTRKKLRVPFLGTAAFLSLVPTQQGLFVLK
jgi:hypothetical protein